MNSSVETILSYTILAGLLSIVYGFFTGKQILNASSGGTMLCRTEFGVVTKGSSDSMTITWTVTVS